MNIAFLRSKGQLTIPPDVRAAARLEEGDPVEIEVTAEGILLRPKKMIDSAQAWFWTEAWQAGEREASEDIAAGRTEVHKTPEDFIGSLE